MRSYATGLSALGLAACSSGSSGPDGGPTMDAATNDQATMDVAQEAEASPVTCLASSGASAFFTINDSTKCVVAAYTMETPELPTLTWGRQGGPLTFSAGVTLDIVRFAVPTTATGMLTATSTTVNPPNIPSGVYWGTEALDLPFFASLDWTAISYTGPSSPYPGELIVVDGTGAVAVRYDVNGFYSTFAVAAMDSGRLLYTSLSPLATSTSTTNAGAFYAADTCGSATNNPRLVPNVDTTCMAPFSIATWQAGVSGPVWVDSAGNAFAMLSTAGANQELHGFAASTVARGQGATTGTSLFSISGYTSTLVADGMTVYFQSNDSMTFEALDVQSIGYGVSGSTLTANGSLSTALTMVTAGTPVSLLVDPQNRLWVGVQDPGVGDAGSTTSTFFVIATKP